MPKHKLKKFQRSQTPPNFRVKDTDMEIIQSISEYRFLDTKQILALHPGNHWTLKKRLKLLFHAGFLDRPIQQFSYFRPSKYLVYALGKKGAEYVFETHGQRIRWTDKNRGATDLFIRHGLMISRFMVALKLALQKIPNSKLILCERENFIDRVDIGEGITASICPDAFFTIEDKGDNLHFFLEADRSTMRHERFLRKMRAFWVWWREGRQKQKLGISRFRVLTITETEERKENLRQLTKQADDSGQGSEMFLFACQKSYSIDNPQSILKSIWQSPKDDKLHHLLE